jgi:hypothetical protein
MHHHKSQSSTSQRGFLPTGREGGSFAAPPDMGPGMARSYLDLFLSFLLQLMTSAADAGHTRKMKMKSSQSACLTSGSTR